MNAKFPHTDKEDWSDCADPQDDLSLHWVSEILFSYVAAHFICLVQTTLFMRDEKNISKCHLLIFLSCMQSTGINS